MGRRRGAALVALVALNAVWFVGGAGPAAACSCLAPPPEAELDSQADLIIVGRATDQVHHATTTNDPESSTVSYAFGQLEYTFAVEYVHKGDVAPVVQLWTSDNDGMCGFGLSIGELYKLYPYRQEDGTLWIGLCSGNRVATAADLQPLAPPTTEPPTTASTEPQSTEPPPTAPQPAETPASLDTSTSTTAPTTSTSTTEPDEDDDGEQAVGINDESAGSGGGAGWLAAAGGIGLVVAAALGTWWWRRVDADRAAGAGIGPEPMPGDA